MRNSGTHTRGSGDHSRKSEKNSDKFVKLSDIMSVNLLVNEESEILLLHDKQFPILLDYVEFDPDYGILNFIDPFGRSIELGITIPPILGNQICQTTEMKTALLRNHEIADFYFIPLIVQMSQKEGGSYGL